MLYRRASRNEYGVVAKTLHWIIAGLLIAQFAIAWSMPDIGPRTRPDMLINLHLSFGALILLIVLIRLTWRALHPVEPVSGDGPQWQQTVAWITHLALYLLVVTIPVLGWAKPTPVDPRNFRNQVRDDILTAIVGPISNFVVAGGALVVLLLIALTSQVGSAIVNIIPYVYPNHLEVLAAQTNSKASCRSLKLTDMVMCSPHGSTIFAGIARASAAAAIVIERDHPGRPGGKILYVTLVTASVATRRVVR